VLSRRDGTPGAAPQRNACKARSASSRTARHSLSDTMMQLLGRELDAFVIAGEFRSETDCRQW
jgi:hypothetical protein